jgi:hypothetical protein
LVKSNPMRMFVTNDGRKFMLPGDHQRFTPLQSPFEGHYCTCHVTMGNDFYFLPKGSCLRKEKVCDHVGSNDPTVGGY